MRNDDRAHPMFLDGSALAVGSNSDLAIDRFVCERRERRRVGRLSARGRKPCP
jgi:hypothetical protein